MEGKLTKDGRGGEQNPSQPDDDQVYRRLHLVLRVGVISSLVLLAAGLAAGAETLVLPGIMVLLALPVVQTVVAGFTYNAGGERRLALMALGLLAVQALAVAAAWL